MPASVTPSQNSVRHNQLSHPPLLYHLFTIPPPPLQTEEPTEANKQTTQERTQNKPKLTTPPSPATEPDLTAAGPLVLANTDKTRFSMWLPPISTYFSSLPPPNNSPPTPSEIALVGIESHICITQTALDLLAAGHRVYVLADGVSSSNREEVGIALARVAAAGAVVTTSEGWIYECMGDAGIPEFKGMIGVVKEAVGDTRAALTGLVGSKI